MPLVRVGQGRLCPRGGGGLSPSARPSALLRPALELALTVAKAGERATPRQPAPRALNRFVGFKRLSSTALDAVQRELDANDDFRRRVAGAATEANVGRSGWLFLTRPDGWEASLEALLAEADPAKPESRPGSDAAGAERTLARRVSRLEEQLRRADAARAKAEKAAGAEREKTSRLNRELVEERRRRRQADRDAEELRRSLAAAEAQTRAAAREAATKAERAIQSEARPDEGAPGHVDPTEAAEAVGRLRAAAAELENAVQAVSRAVGGTPGRAAPGGSPRVRQGAGSAPRRRASPLPFGVFDDSAEAAGHLVRLPGAVILVDGYNASMSLWPGTPVGEQRQRLMDALAELASRTGSEVRVVFDGSEGTVPRVAPPRSPVKVAFSPPDVEADDVIIGLAGSLPAEVPVVVASDDQRVRDGARRRGANLLTTAQLAAALGREA